MRDARGHMAARTARWWLLLVVLIAAVAPVKLALAAGRYQAPSANLQAPIPVTQAAITVTVTADPPQLTVGDVVTLTITAVHPADSRVLWPTWGETWGELEIRAQQAPQTVAGEPGMQTTAQTMQATLWTPGVYTTLPLTMTIAAADGELQEITAVPITLTVYSVLNEDDLTLRDIKPQASLQAPSRWPWLLGGLLGAAALAAAVYWARRHWPQRQLATAVSLPAVDNRPAHEIALAELARITALDLPAQARFKDHYTLVSDVLRHYLQGAFDLPALDRTTAELRRDLHATPIAPASQAHLITLLDEADLVKFAQVIPDLPAAQQFPAQAQQFVLATAALQPPIADPQTSPLAGESA
ncbi:MAG: hypothetical protein H6665_01105 [Ardenticatenaceae bacterium]|nr:hypothetical protein [Ardenticatenaceae bacterium]